MASLDLSYIPFVHAQGIELVRSGAGESELRMSLRPDQQNYLGVAHGGILMTLLDVTLAQAARAADEGLRVITIEMKTTFMQPASGVLTGRGRLLHRTARMAYVEGSVFDAEGRICAHATGTFRYITPRTEGEKS